jgi:6-phosphogluconolactonase
MPTKLQLSGDVYISEGRDDLHDRLAGLLVAAARQAVNKRDVFHLALSGGSTPEPFYMHLVTDPRFRNMPWENTHVWVVDERRVPHDDELSNFKLLRETLVDHVPIRRRRVHPMESMAQDPAAAYEQQLREAFNLNGSDGAPLAVDDDATIIHSPAHAPTTPKLDFVLLGMGADGHTASLFPGSDAVGERNRWVVVNSGPQVTPPDRITMTYPLLNAARQIVVLVTGAKKAETLRQIDAQLQTGKPDLDKWPVTGIDPQDENLAWFLDEAAAGIENPDSGEE